MTKIVRSFFVIILTLLGLYLSQGVFSDGYLFQNVYDSSFRNDTARIDIYNTDGADIALQDTEGLTVDYPNWCKYSNGDSCSIANVLIKKEWQPYKITFDVLNTGKVKIKLRGPYQKEGKIIRPILVDYQKFQVEDKIYLETNKIAQHEMEKKEAIETPLLDVKKGQQISFIIMVRRHSFKWSDLTEFYHFNLREFISALVVSFIFAYLIVFFFCDIKHSYHLDNRSFFIGLVLLLLILPMMNLSQKNISEQENRTLAKFPEIIKENKINQKFGPEFNDWASDRIWGRETIINLRFHLLHTINGKLADDVAFVGDDGYMFFTSAIRKPPSLSWQEKDVKNIADTIIGITNKLQTKNISIYLTLLPRRHLILQKYWDNYYPPAPQLDYEKELTRLLSNHPNIHFIELFDDLKNASLKHQIFYKTDTHLNGEGEYILKYNLWKRMKKEFSVLKKIDEINERITKQVDYNDISRHFFKNPPKQDDVRIRIIKQPNYESSTLGKKVINKNEIIFHHRKNKKAPIPKTAVFLGGCNTVDICDSFQFLFRESICIRGNLQHVPGENDFVSSKIKELYNLPNDSVIFLFVGSTNFTENTNYLIENIKKGL